MAKRFTDTDLWKEDWFIKLPVEYQYFFFYVKDSCDHAGIWKANKTYFELITRYDIDIEKAFEFYNKDKERFMKINGTRWLYKDFFVFQYGNKMNLNNRVHGSIHSIYVKLGVKLTSIRGLLEHNLTSPMGLKDKDKDKDKDNIYKIKRKKRRREEEGY